VLLPQTANPGRGRVPVTVERDRERRAGHRVAGQPPFDVWWLLIVLLRI
jgi:hypothetical protein